MKEKDFVSKGSLNVYWNGNGSTQTLWLTEYSVGRQCPMKGLRACPFEWVLKFVHLCLPLQHFDDSAPQRSCIVVIDNGKGMTPRQLNNWAIYRLSKFIRREKKFKGWDLKLCAEYSVCCCLGYVSDTVKPLVLAQNEKETSEKE